MSGGVSGVMQGSAVKTEEARARKRARAGGQDDGAVPADEPHRPANYVLRYTCEGHENSVHGALLPFRISKVVAPMVGQSDLAFR